MKTYPARNVGSFGAEMEWGRLVGRDLKIGDCVFFDRVDGKRVIHFKCACAFGRHEVPVAAQPLPGTWQLVSENPPHIEPSLLTTAEGMATRCHLFLRNGELTMLDDTTGTLP